MKPSPGPKAREVRVFKVCGYEPHDDEKTTDLRRVEARTAKVTIRRIALASHFPGTYGVLFKPDALGRHFFLTEREALEAFEVTSRKREATFARRAGEAKLDAEWARSAILRSLLWERVLEGTGIPAPDGVLRSKP